jgi:hypothetical protein
MPPRFAYWTILIDQKPTAFRAAEKEDLLPTLVQLQRKNPDVVLKWFARGKLWDTPEQATWARHNLDHPSEKRNRDWRPGGKHEDPRMRFKKGGRRDSPRAAFAKKTAAEAKFPAGKPEDTWEKPVRRESDAPRPLPSGPKPSAYAKASADRPRGERPKWTGERKPYTGDRPKWTGERRAPSAGSKWTGERKAPSTFGKPSADKPSGDRERPKWGGDRRPPSGDRPKWSRDRERTPPAAKRSDSDAPRPLPTKPLSSSRRPAFGKPSGDKPWGKPRGDRPFKKPDRNRR